MDARDGMVHLAVKSAAGTYVDDKGTDRNGKTVEMKGPVILVR